MRGAGRWLGVGIASYVELTGIGSAIPVSPGMPVATGTEAGLMGGTLLRDGTVVLVGLGGVVLRSRDGGRSFAAVTLAGWPGLAAVIEAADGGLRLLGEGGVREAAP